MVSLDRIDWEILDATADDWENLEQVFLSVCFEVLDTGSKSSAPASVCHRRIRESVLLEEVADRIRSLVDRGLLTAKREDGAPVTSGEDLSFVWKAWFRMSSEGKQLWEASEYATLVENE